MKIRRIFAIRYVAVSLMFLLLSSLIVAQEQQRGSDKYLCTEPNPQSICNADNTCGSSSVPCVVDIKRTAAEASATPSIPKAKANMPFCVKVGTTVTWKSVSKNTGFVVDFGPDSPFEPAGAIIGGSDRAVSSVVKKKGCYKYSAGACVSGAIYGMCGSVETELVITGGQ
jgi:plastocyanin